MWLLECGNIITVVVHWIVLSFAVKGLEKDIGIGVEGCRGVPRAALGVNVSRSPELEGAFLDFRRILGSVSRAAEGCPGRPCEQICARPGFFQAVRKEIHGRELQGAFLDFRRILGLVSRAAEGCRGLPRASM